MVGALICNVQLQSLAASPQRIATRLAHLPAPVQSRKVIQQLCFICIVQAICKDADILVAAIGKAEFVPGSWIKPGAVVIDVGMNDLEVGLLCILMDLASGLGSDDLLTC